MNPTLDDPVDPRQRRHATVLGLLIGGVFLALTTTYFMVFWTHGLPKDPKEWKRLQEQRSAAAAEQTTTPPPVSATTSATTPAKDQPR